MKNFFFYQKNFKILNFFFKNKKKYLFVNDNIGKYSLNNVNYIKDDIFNFQNNADINLKAIKIANQINYLKKYKNNQIIDKSLKKSLTINIEEILRTAYLSEKIRSYYQLDNLYICRFFNDLNLFNYLKDNKYISNEIKISKIYYILNKFFIFIENLYFFIKLFFLPEIAIFLCRKNNHANFKYIFNLDKEPDKENLGSFLELRKNLKEKSLVIKDIQLGDKILKKNVKKYPQFDLFYIISIFKNISPIAYLNKFYYKYFIERLKLILLFQLSYKELYRYLLTKICWEIFFDCFNVEKSLTAMLPSNLTSQIIQKRNTKETIFLFFSSTPNLSSDKNDLSAVDHVQYNYMDYSTLIANSVSIKYFKKKTNNFNNYKDFGSIESTLASNYKNKKIFFKSKLNINDNKKIVGVFDNAISFRGVLSNKEYLEFLKSLNFIVQKYKNLNFILNKKGKENYFNTKIFNSNEINFELKKLKNNNNFINFDYELSTAKILSISDYVITQPYSSIIYESLNLGKVTLIYAGNDNFIHSDEDYAKIANRLNIDTRYIHNLFDDNNIDKFKINSKISLEISKISNKKNYFNDLYEYLER